MKLDQESFTAGLIVLAQLCLRRHYAVIHHNLATGAAANISFLALIFPFLTTCTLLVTLSGTKEPHYSVTF